MNQHIFGGRAIYVDITDYLKSKKDGLFFANLVKEAIEKEQNSPYSFREDVEKVLWEFHKAIVDYAQELPD